MKGTMMNQTPQHRPPLEPSDEATIKGLRFAQEQGDVYQQALDYMTNEVAQGTKKHAGDYLVGYAVEEAEGMYRLHDGQLQWEEPSEENIHVEVAVCDGADGRFIPGLTVYVTILNNSGKEIGTHQQPFLWHPMLYHYGRNWQVPGDGEYTLRVRIEIPDFPRHDKTNGKRYTQPVEVEFAHVQIKTGQKKS
jgi:Fe2+ transport protein